MVLSKCVNFIRTFLIIFIIRIIEVAANILRYFFLFFYALSNFLIGV